MDGPSSVRFALVAVTASGCLAKDNPVYGVEGDGTGSRATDTSMPTAATGATTDATTGAASGAASSTTTGTTTASTTGATSGAAETSAGSGSALLQFEQAPSFDFGAHEVGMNVRAALDLTNVGDAEATAFVVPALPAPYSFAGGSYPGMSGTCMDALGPGQSCTMVVEYAPDALGAHTAVLALDYASTEGPGTASVDLTGIGSGRTENLLVNPGGEMGGDPPVGWTEAFGDEWTVYGDGFQRSGSFAILCGFVDGQSGTYRLQQTFDLTEYADIIDNQEGLQIDYEGYARTYGFNDDIYRFRLRTLDGGGNEVDVDVTNSDTGTDYTLHQLGLVTQPGVREVEAQVIGIFNAGSSCDALFDDLSLTLAYPPT